jgi:hypothetical protein
VHDEVPLVLQIVAVHLKDDVPALPGYGHAGLDHVSCIVNDCEAGRLAVAGGSSQALPDRAGQVGLLQGVGGAGGHAAIPPKLSAPGMSALRPGR